MLKEKKVETQKWGTCQQKEKGKHEKGIYKEISGLQKKVEGAE